LQSRIKSKAVQAYQREKLVHHKNKVIVLMIRREPVLGYDMNMKNLSNYYENKFELEWDFVFTTGRLHV